MDLLRIWHSFRLYTILSVGKRAAYMKKKKIFREMGDHVSIVSRQVPLYPKLIRFHNNIVVASNVSFITHDAMHHVMNRMSVGGEQVLEDVGCIEIMDNVFIGAGSRIMSGVRVGPNAVIGAGSIVTHDIPPNSVAVGVPAKVIGTFDDLCNKRLTANKYPRELKSVGLVASDALADHLWDAFEKAHCPSEDNC